MNRPLSCPSFVMWICTSTVFCYTGIHSFLVVPFCDHLWKFSPILFSRQIYDHYESANAAIKLTHVINYHYVCGLFDGNSNDFVLYSNFSEKNFSNLIHLILIKRLVTDSNGLRRGDHEDEVSLLSIVPMVVPQQQQLRIILIMVPYC